MGVTVNVVLIWPGAPTWEGPWQSRYRGGLYRPVFGTCCPDYSCYAAVSFASGACSPSTCAPSNIIWATTP
jgi:hypothetical protein